MPFKPGETFPGDDRRDGRSYFERQPANPQPDHQLTHNTMNTTKPNLTSTHMPARRASMNTPIVVAVALAFNCSATTHAQTATPSKPATVENALPAGVTPKRVLPAKFKSEYAEVGMPQDMHVVTYLGQREGRAYINRRSKSFLFQKKWSDHVIFVELAELDESFRNALPRKELKDAK
jgi:hypothetical protein